jgi:hypothetical protein
MSYVPSYSVIAGWIIYQLSSHGVFLHYIFNFMFSTETLLKEHIFSYESKTQDTLSDPPSSVIAIGFSEIVLSFCFPCSGFKKKTRALSF